MAVEHEDGDTRQWFAIWTNSHAEQLVHDQLVAQGLDAYLPMVPTWSRRAGIRRLIAQPIFPGYLFVHQAMDKQSYIRILKVRGVVRLLGERWDRLTPIPAAEILSLQRVLTSELPVFPHPHLREGQRVRIHAGPLAGVEGVFLRSRPHRGLLVLSVELLCQSISVEVDCTVVSPIGGPPPVVHPPLATAVTSWL